MLVKKIVKRGSSNFILIPKDLMDMLNLKLGDYVFMEIKDNNIIIKPADEKNEANK